MITDEQAKIAIEAYWSNETDELPAMRKALEAYEQSKPKPEPVAYKVCNPAGCVLVESRKSAEKLSSEYGNGTYQPLYTTPLTREPLSEDEIRRLWKNGTNVETIVEFARLIEQAHGIGVTND